jgi:DNA-binding GntR family transcriptional regulator
MQRRRNETLAAMRAAAEDMRVAYEAGDTLRSARADDHFHDASLEHCGNPYLVNAYRLVSSKVAALRSHRSTLPTRKQASAEHLVIVGMLEAGQVTKALQNLSVHILLMADRYSVEAEPASRTVASRGARTATLEHIGPLVD